MVAPAYLGCIVLRIGTTQAFNFNVFIFLCYIINFNGLIFGAGIFLVIDFFPIQSSPSLEIWSTPLGTWFEYFMPSISDTDKFMMVS